MGAAEIVAVLMVVAVCTVLFAGYPVALTLGGVSLAFAAIGEGAGILNFSLLGALPQRMFGVMTNEVLLAIPLFIFMGVMLERSRIAEELLETRDGCSVRFPAGWASRCCWLAPCWRPPKGWSAPPQSPSG